MTFSVVLSDTQHEEDFLTVLQFGYMEDDDEIKLMLTRQLAEEDPEGAKEYYQEIGVCQPDNLCNTIKNPLSYVKRKKL